jgi:hypothetical protein
VSDYDPNDINQDGSVNILDIIAKAQGGVKSLQQGMQLSSIAKQTLSGVGEARAVDQGIIGEQPTSEGTELNVAAANQITIDTPLQSVPAISQMGAAPFSGSINWNAIPGGFQPLPLAGGSKSKRLYQISQFHGGINQKGSPRDIADNECQTATNLTFSDIGKMKPLGDMKTSTSTGLTAVALAGAGTPNAGYGWFIFKSGYSLASTPLVGDYTINVTQDGDDVQLVDNGSADVRTLDIANEDINVAPVYYAAGGGFYACDANFAHTTSRQCAMLVHRKDINGTVEVKGWVTGEALLPSPVVHASNADGVELKATHGNAGDTGRTEIAIIDTGTGTWSGTYTFYLSYIFDNGVETGLSALGTDAFVDEQCQFNVSIQHTNADPLGGNQRIEGARLYFRHADSSERWLLAEIHLIDGIKGALDTTYTSWDNPTGTTYDLASEMIFNDPPEIYSYASINGYPANEVYTKSPDTYIASTPLDVRYKTATVGQQGSVFIGNVIFNGKVFADGMMYSMPGKSGVFPQYNMFDSPSSDGTPIIALASFQDTILQFKDNAMYVINIANPGQFYAEASFRDCGVANPCQVFTTSFGVIFANKFGCFIYDGQKVISLTNGKFDIGDWAISEASSIGIDAADNSSGSSSVPSVGYDPRGQNIIVLKDIGHESNKTEAWVYNMVTQSWTKGDPFIDNADNDVTSNFQISPNGYLSMIHYDASNPPEAPYTYNPDLVNSPDTQTITYVTKDIDFGFPNNKKKIQKIFVTYAGNANSLTATYIENGHPTVNGAMTNAESSDATFVDAGEISSNNTYSFHNRAIFTLDSHPASLYSIQLKFTGSVEDEFEINDITIQYRLKPRAI